MKAMRYGGSIHSYSDRTYRSKEGIMNKLRKLHPLPVLIYFVILLGIQMWTFNTYLIVAGYIASSVCMIYMGGIVDYLRKLPLDAIVVALCAGVNLLAYHDGETILFYLNGNRVTLEAINFGVHMGVYIVTVIKWCLLYGRIMTEDEFIYLFGRIAPTVALMLSQVFRTIPYLREDYKNIRMASVGMGKSGVRARMGDISTLISKSLEESIYKGEVMEDRGYGVGKRTNYHRFRFKRRDLIAIIIEVIVGMLLFTEVISGRMSTFFYPKYEFKAGNTELLIVAAGLFIYGILPTLLKKDEIR